MIFLSGAIDVIEAVDCKSLMSIGFEDEYFLVEATCDWGCKSLMVIDFESGWYFLVRMRIRMILIEAVRV